MPVSVDLKLLRLHLCASIAGAFFVAQAAPVTANKFPEKPVRMVVPLAPGGGSDIVGRIAAQALSEQWGQPVVVDNRPGAGGTIGNGIVAKSDPDGYTVLVSSSTMAIGPALYKNLSSDILRDFAAVTLIVEQPSIIAVNTKVPAKSLTELVALFKTQPGKYAFGSAGNGTASHLANELFRLSAKVDTLHVPYKSAGLASTGLLSGEIQFMVTNMATALPLVRAGRLNGVAVTSAKRVPAAADLPTAGEAGLPGFEYTTWYGMLAPAGTPKPVIARLYGDLSALLRQPRLQERFSAQSFEVRVTAPQDFSKYLAREVTRWQQVVNAAGIQKQ
ncbi:MAG: tripartite tricarboxylate transporter substrate binding protein [Burkholderiales bacterium]|nr:tripartite tricarboxylate transporter substrate binding protein [Burkholderiales bacterium]